MFMLYMFRQHRAIFRQWPLPEDASVRPKYVAHKHRMYIYILYYTLHTYILYVYIYIYMTDENRKKT
jgi:hypothetical protein